MYGAICSGVPLYFPDIYETLKRDARARRRRIIRNKIHFGALPAHEWEPVQQWSGEQRSTTQGNEDELRHFALRIVLRWLKSFAPPSP